MRALTRAADGPAEAVTEREYATKAAMTLTVLLATRECLKHRTTPYFCPLSGTGHRGEDWRTNMNMSNEPEFGDSMSTRSSVGWQFDCGVHL